MNKLCSLKNSDCRYNGPCEYRINGKPGESDMDMLINGLHRQIELMEENAELLNKLYPDFGHHKELMGAAKITQNWLDNIEAIEL